MAILTTLSLFAADHLPWVYVLVAGGALLFLACVLLQDAASNSSCDISVMSPAYVTPGLLLSQGPDRRMGMRCKPRAIGLRPGRARTPGQGTLPRRIGRCSLHPSATSKAGTSAWRATVQRNWHV